MCVRVCERGYNKSVNKLIMTSDKQQKSCVQQETTTTTFNKQLQAKHVPMLTTNTHTHICIAIFKESAPKYVTSLQYN